MAVTRPPGKNRKQRRSIRQLQTEIGGTLNMTRIKNNQRRGMIPVVDAA